MRLIPGPAERRLAGRIADAGTRGVLLDRRRSGHLAVLSAVMTVTVFGYFLLDPRTVRVLADGRELELETTLSNDAAIVGRAGVDLDTGDRLTALNGDGALVLRVERARAVTLEVDGVVRELRTHARTVEQLLDEAGETLGERDSALINGELAPSTAPLTRAGITVAASVTDDAPISVAVRRAVTFTIADGGREIVSTSSRPTVAQALREAGIVVGPGDAVEPQLQASLDADARINVRHAAAVTIALPDEHRVLYTLEPTVGALLDAEGVVLPEGGFVDPSRETAITPGMSVRVVQLSASNEIEREYIESATVYRSDDSLGPGETRTEPGHDGVRVRRYDVSYVNGAEAGRELIEEYYEREPADTVVYYPVQRGATDAVPEGATLQTLRVYATYYTPASAGRAASDPAYGRTATGALVTYGIVAVDPDVIPLGTRMFIPGYGYAVAADTGGAVQGYIIDLGFPDGVTVTWKPGWLDIYILP